MTLLDAYALIAFLVGGPAAAQVRTILREGDTAVTTVNLVEVLDVSARVHGMPITRTMGFLEPLFEETLAIRHLDLSLARRAAEIRAKHYDRSGRPISLADAVLIAAATSNDRLATSDPDVLGVADLEQVETVVLPEQG